MEKASEGSRLTVPRTDTGAPGWEAQGVSGVIHGEGTRQISHVTSGEVVPGAGPRGLASGRSDKGVPTVY